MIGSTLYSIGHGNKKIEDFIAELESFKIQYLLDIRSKPYSKWSPQFNRPTLEAELKKSGIDYVYAGDQLGGLPSDTSCYDHHGKVVYDILKEKDFFKEGLKRLITANKKHINLAIMCSEANPQECHRTKLIGQELLKSHISLKHIVGPDKSKPQELVMNELNKGLPVVDLFGNDIHFISRRSFSG